MTPERTEPAAVAIGLRSERGPVLAALMLSMALVALDTTIIATVVPSITHQLGGFSQFPWLFSSYLLTQAITVPLYGRFADVVGRRPVLFVGIGVFLLGSVLCGVAWSMPALIVFRGVQGIGAGAVQPMTMTIIGDLYTVQERARVQGYIASVWGAASVLGPAIGGIFAQYLSWRWIFFVNLPVGALAVWMLTRHFAENVTRRRHAVDYLGAGLLALGSSLFILGLLESGVAWRWASVRSAVVFSGALVALAAFVVAERRAAEPVLPLWVFRQRTLVAGNAVAIVVGALLIGLSSYVPAFVQGVLGTGPLVAGFTLSALTIGWPLAAGLSGRVYMRIGFRDTSLIGSLVVIAGTVLCAILPSTASIARVAVACFVVGIGLGLLSSPTVVAVQSVVGWDRRGVVTGAHMFSRSIGSAVGAAVFGAIANSMLAQRFAHPPAALSGRLPPSADATSLVFDRARTGGPPGLAAFVRSALYDATHLVFVALVVAALAGAGALLAMPRRSRPLVLDAKTDPG